MSDKTEIETKAQSAIKRTERDVAAWSKTLSSFLEKNTKTVLKELQSKGGLSQLSAAAALGQLEEAMDSSGLKKVFDDASDIYRDQLDAVREETKLSLGTKVNYSRVFREHVDQFISLKNQQQTKTLLNYVDDMRSVIAEQVLLGITPDFDALADDANARTVANLKTDFTSEVAAFNRQISFEAFDEIGAEYVLYAGNVEDTTRPFCEARAGKVFRLDTVKKWDNGQGLPVIPYLGGYNCRHRLVAVRKSLADQIGISDF